MSNAAASKSSLLNSVFTKCLALIFGSAIFIMIAMTYSSYVKAVGITSGIVSEMAIASTVATASGFGNDIADGQTEGAIQSARNMIAQSEGLADLAIIFDTEGRMLSTSQTAPPEDATALQVLANQSLQSGEMVQNFETLDTAVPYRTTSGELVGVIAIDWSSANVVAIIREATLTSFLIALALLGAALTGSYILLRHILGQPLNQVNEALKNMIGGDYDTRLSGSERKDEFGALAARLDHMRQSLAQGRQLSQDAEEKQKAQTAVMQALRASLKKLAAGQLATNIQDKFAPEYADLVADFNETAGAFHDAVAQVVQLSDKIKQDSTSVKSYSEDLSQRTENQAATLEETAAALDDLTNGVRGAAEGTREVEAIVQKARSEATQSGEVVQKTIGAMSEISESSNQISAIIAVIDDIAFQTNLLALNAGVEAARAGEAGRGFAVVASEVRALAQRSSEAAHEIKTLISGSSEHVANGVSLVAEAGKALTAITDRVVHIATLMSDMADNAQEQATSLDEINVGVGQLDQVTQRNASMVEEANTVTMSLEAQTTALASLVAQFTLDEARESDLYILQDRVA